MGEEENTNEQDEKIATIQMDEASKDPAARTAAQEINCKKLVLRSERFKERKGFENGYWISENGKKTAIKDLDLRHAENIKNKIEQEIKKAQDVLKMDISSAVGTGIISDFIKEEFATRALFLDKALLLSPKDLLMKHSLTYKMIADHVEKKTVEEVELMNKQIEEEKLSKKSKTLIEDDGTSNWF